VNIETPDELEAALVLIREANSNYLLIGNKTDVQGLEKVTQKFAGADILFISAKDKFHIDLLKERLVAKVVHGNINTENTIITNARHYEALKEVDISLTDIKEGLDNNISGDLLALDIRRCLHYISEITGDVSNEHILDYIFSKFCIGK
jgi:tRNA modification GTPase